MAEPIGISASIATLLELGGKIGKAAREYRQASEEVARLENEVHGLHSVFEQVNEVCKRIPEM